MVRTVFASADSRSAEGATVTSGEKSLVAFDLGGVLVDVDLNALMRRFSRPKGDVEHAFFAAGRHDALSIGEIDAREFIASAAASLDVAAIDAREAWGDVVSVRRGACELVDRVTCDVIAWSNTDAIHAERLASGLPARLLRRDARAFSHEIGVAKPDPRFFVCAMERIGIAPDRVLFIDDRRENIEAARALGIEASVAASLEDVDALLAARRLLQSA
jgi:FMN phosphatase YigB (HAD superfamily)